MHTVILGNGIIALTTAFRLAKRAGSNDRITVLGRATREGSGTLAAAAMLNSFAEIEQGSLDCEIDRYRFDLSRLAARMWPDFEQEITQYAKAATGANNEHLHGRCGDTGTYIVNNTAADILDDENFDAIVKALTHYAEPFSHLSPREIPNYQPAQRTRATRAIYLPNEGWFNPRLMMERINIALCAFPQVTTVDANATLLLQDANAIAGVVLDNGETVAGDHYVLATGASATDLMAKSGLDLPIQRVFYGVGVSIEIKSNDAPHVKCVRTPNRGLACGVYSAPYFNGEEAVSDHVLVGASNFISPTPYFSGRLASVSTLMNAAIEQINSSFYRADLIRVNVGWRPTSVDTYPLIGRTSFGNLIVATGTKRDGIHMSPLISQRLVEMLIDGTDDEGFRVFAPERRPIRSLSRKDAIEKAVRHQVSAAYQHGFTPAHNRMPEQVQRMFRDDLEHLHDQVGAHDWGIPPEMLDMYRYGHARGD